MNLLPGYTVQYEYLRPTPHLLPVQMSLSNHPSAMQLFSCSLSFMLHSTYIFILLMDIYLVYYTFHQSNEKYDVIRGGWYKWASMSFKDKMTSYSKRGYFWLRHHTVSGIVKNDLMWTVLYFCGTKGWPVDIKEIHRMLRKCKPGADFFLDKTVNSCCLSVKIISSNCTK